MPEPTRNDAGEQAMVAAILGELIPELEYAAPVLLARSERGRPLVATTSPSDIGFEIGAVDSVLLELFKSLVPYVKTVLGWGVLRVIQAWCLADRASRDHDELVATLRAQMEESAELRRAIATIAGLLDRRERIPVSTDDIIDSIASAASRLDAVDDPRSDT